MDIKNKILVLSGKGGVGKTTVAVNIATKLAMMGKETGILDVDIHGPNVPKMLGLNGIEFQRNENMLIPVEHSSKLKVVSIAFLIGEKDSVAIRGPMKHNIIKEFIELVNWGNLDYLIMDFPPGTGDEQMSAIQLMKDVTGAIIISTPQKVSILDSVRTIDFCKKMNVPIFGIIENMSGGIFGSDTIENVAKENGIPFLGKIELNKDITNSGDDGIPAVMNETNPISSFDKIIEVIVDKCK